MKVVVFLVVFASFICYGHSIYGPRRHPLECYLNARCIAKNYSNHLHHVEYQELNCEGKCAGWQCIVDNVMYQIYGCENDINICSNKDETDSKFSKYYTYVTCELMPCSFLALQYAVRELGDVNRSELMDGECNVTKGERLGTIPFSPTTTIVSLQAASRVPNGINALSKNDVLKIAVGMVLFGWYFVAHI